jgi:acetyl-CoA carboxylase carboxyltransferase component
MTKPFDKDDTTMRNATEERRQREHKLLESVGYRKVKVSEEQEREAKLRSLEERNDFLQKRVDALLEDNDRLMLELQARVQSSVDDARRKSWGGNGRY